MNNGRHMHRIALPALALAAALCWSGTSLAESDSERAARLYQQGNAAVDQKRWADAEAAYLQAWAITRTFDVAANLGIVELRLGKPRKAAEFLAYSQRNAPPSSKPAQRERTKQLLEEALKQVGAVRVRPSVADAHVTIDGEAVAAADLPYDLYVDPGTHTVEATREGYKSERVTFEAKAGTSQEVALTLTPLPPPRRSPIPAVVLGSAAAVGLGVGIGFTVASNGKASDVDGQRAAILKGGGQCVKPPSAFAGACADLKSAGTSADTFANVAKVAYVASGALAIGAVTYLLLPAPSRAKTGRLRILPTAGAESAGVTVLGVW